MLYASGKGACGGISVEEEYGGMLSDSFRNETERGRGWEWHGLVDAVGEYEPGSKGFVIGGLYLEVVSLVRCCVVSRKRLATTGEATNVLARTSPGRQSWHSTATVVRSSRGYCESVRRANLNRINNLLSLKVRYCKQAYGNDIDTTKDSKSCARLLKERIRYKCIHDGRKWRERVYCKFQQVPVTCEP